MTTLTSTQALASASQQLSASFARKPSASPTEQLLKNAVTASQAADKAALTQPQSSGSEDASTGSTSSTADILSTVDASLLVNLDYQELLATSQQQAAQSYDDAATILQQTELLKVVEA